MIVIVRVRYHGMIYMQNIKLYCQLTNFERSHAKSQCIHRISIFSIYQESPIFFFSCELWITTWSSECEGQQFKWHIYGGDCYIWLHIWIQYSWGWLYYMSYRWNLELPTFVYTWFTYVQIVDIVGMPYPTMHCKLVQLSVMCIRTQSLIESTLFCVQFLTAGPFNYHLF